MGDRGVFLSVGNYGWHKGFYNDNDFEDTLLNIQYNNYFEEPDDEDFPHTCAYYLLCGSCHIFALSLNKVLGYNAYVIEEVNSKGFHVFCQVNKKGKVYYIDARGITTSFDEFMEIAQRFVKDEFIIRPVDSHDIDEWKDDDNYDKEGYEFAEAVIKEYSECYSF